MCIYSLSCFFISSYLVYNDNSDATFLDFKMLHNSSGDCKKSYTKNDYLNVLLYVILY